MKVGKYELLEPLGKGGFATVYRARDPLLARTVAVKVCQATDHEGVERFFREARLTGQLQHPNIAQVLDFGVESGVPYIVQEFLPGWDLAQLLLQGPLPTPFLLSVLVQVARGLAHAHARHVLHRDIKPSNIRVLPTGLVKIMDFGIGRLIQDENRLTRSGEALGTVGYFSPEILLGRPLDHRADLFSFGVMAYELIAGKHPFLSQDLGSSLYAIVHHHPPPLAELSVGCSFELSEVVMRCLAKEPAERWATTQELVERLEALAHRLGVEVGAVVPDTPLPAAQPASTSATLLARSRVWWRAYATPAVLLLAGSALVVLAMAGLRQDAGRSSPPQEVKLASPAPVVPSPPSSRPPEVATPTPVVELPVEIVAVPPAFVVVGGRELGKIARETIHLAPGRYEVTFSIPGYRRESRTVVVDEATREIRLTMPPYGLLSVVPEFGTPLAGSQVFFGNRLLGSLPVVNAKVPEGTDLLRVTWPDGSVFEVSCQVEAERVTTVSVAKPY